MPAAHSINPFLALQTDLPMVALRGKRNGYIMLAPTQEITTYSELPPNVLLAAKDWAATLERLGSPRTYWMTLSEVTPHLHIHLFPRWSEDSLKGVPLFESRETLPQPGWTEAVQNALAQWAQQHQVALA